MRRNPGDSGKQNSRDRTERLSGPFPTTTKEPRKNESRERKEMNHQDLKEEVRNTLREFHMVSRGDRIVAGVSGGADSVCLLLLMQELAKELSVRIYAVHVNHGLRKTAGRDEWFTEELCSRLEIPLRIYRIDAAEEAKRRRIGVEEAGRELRYELFGRACREWEQEETGSGAGSFCWKIAVAHHCEDSAETVLMNLCRGTSLKGLSGIRPVNGDIIRPLIRCSRAGIEEELRRRGQSWCTDESNENLAYTRNLIRNRILPELCEGVNARASEHICRTAEDLAAADAFLEELTAKSRKECRNPDGKECYLTSKLLGLPPYLRKRTLYLLLSESCGQKDLTSEHVALLEKLLGTEGSHSVDFPGGIRAEKSYDELRLIRHSEGKTEPTGTGGKAAADRAERTKNRLCPENEEAYLVRVFPYSGNPADIPADPYTKWFDYDRISSFLTFRTRREGDSIAIGFRRRNTDTAETIPGREEQKLCRKKLTRVMIDQKIPAAWRDRMVLPTDGDRILWVPGGPIGADFRICSETKKILELSLKEQ